MRVRNTEIVVKTLEEMSLDCPIDARNRAFTLYSSENSFTQVTTIMPNNSDDQRFDRERPS